MKNFQTSALFFALVSLAACGGQAEQKTGTLKIMANGEDFVRQGFVSEDGWTISFEAVYLNVEGPTAYQVVEESQNALSLRHGGHPHEYIPEGSAHVALLGEYFLALKQDPFEVGRDENAPIGNYNRLAFNVKKSSAESQGGLAEYEGFSWEGDGVNRRWHYRYNSGKLGRHLGTATHPPYRVTWNTEWLPTQSQPMRIKARVTGENGITYVTPVVGNITLQRNYTVRLYSASDVPQNFQSRVNKRKECTIKVSDQLNKASAARLVVSVSATSLSAMWGFALASLFVFFSQQFFLRWKKPVYSLTAIC